MKRDRKGRDRNRDLYDLLWMCYEDDRYWGIFPCEEPEHASNCGIKIDMRRFRKTTGDAYRPTEAETEKINARRTHYFYPARRHEADYSCNVFFSVITELKRQWETVFLPRIRRELEEVPKPELKTPASYEPFLCGISGPVAAEMTMRVEYAFAQMEYENHCDFIVQSLYAQFFHYMVARVEAVMVEVLAKHGTVVEHFDRNVFYGNAEQEAEIRNFAYFPVFDRTYRLWHFLKHNSLSTYKKVNDAYREVLHCKDYAQGSPAFECVAFSEQLIAETFTGLIGFFGEYCELMYGENFAEAQWNYADRFLDIMAEAREPLVNPLGLSPWDDSGGD